METANNKPVPGGFLSNILGPGIKDAVDSIGNAIDKIDRSDENWAFSSSTRRCSPL